MSERVYRVDKFVVPNNAREELPTESATDSRAAQGSTWFPAGFRSRAILGSGRIQLRHYRGIGQSGGLARAEVQPLQREAKFNPQEIFGRLAIKADIANYKRLEA